MERTDEEPVRHSVSSSHTCPALPGELARNELAKNEYTRSPVRTVAVRPKFAPSRRTIRRVSIRLKFLPHPSPTASRNQYVIPSLLSLYTSLSYQSLHVQPASRNQDTKSSVRSLHKRTGLAICRSRFSSPRRQFALPARLHSPYPRD